MFPIQKQRTTTEVYEAGDLVYYFEYDKAKLALVVKAKKLLKLYDILIQTENVYIKDVHINSLQKAS